jgi:hypothetical protein
MRTPADVALEVEERPVLPSGDGERVSGYGVLGLPFASGHVLGMRRWTASSVGERFTSIWHRDPTGRWTFYESIASEVACTRYFGADVIRVQEGPIDLTWDSPNRLIITTADEAVDWRIDLGSTAATRIMSAMGPTIPMAAWRSGPVLDVLGAAAGRMLHVGTVKLSGVTSNGQRFVAHPLRMWSVTGSHAVVEGEDLGPIGPLDEQARLADFYIPQRGIFAVGRVLMRRSPNPSGPEVRADNRV